MSIDPNLSIILQNRKVFKKILDSMSIEQINNIPEGFNNNMIWHCGHIVVVQQMLTFGLAGLPSFVSEDIVKEFRPGTFPSKYYDETAVNDIKSQLFSTYEHLISALKSGAFEQIKPFMTAMKYEINDISSAIAFNQYHEAMHLGSMLMIKKFI